MQVWILKGRNDELYRSMWVQAMDAMLARLVGIADKDQLQYVGNMNGCDPGIAHRCFSPCNGAKLRCLALQYCLAKQGAYHSRSCCL